MIFIDYIIGIMNQIVDDTWSLDCTIDCNLLLVGSLEHFFVFTYIGNFIIPSDLHIYRGASTTTQIFFMKSHRAQELVERSAHLDLPDREPWIFQIFSVLTPRKG